MLTSVQRWRAAALFLSALIVADWVAALTGFCVQGLIIMTIALLTSFGVLVAGGMALVMTGPRLYPAVPRFDDPADYRSIREESSSHREGGRNDG